MMGIEVEQTEGGMPDLDATPRDEAAERMYALLDKVRSEGIDGD